MQINWQSASQTHTGNVRQLNEDAFLDCADQQLWVVADGMGGHQAGDLASQMIIDTLSDFRQTEHLGKNIDSISGVIKTVNSRLIAMAQQRRAEIIGSTVALFHAINRYGVCVWAGDSRIYRYRDGRLVQLTRDHTYNAEMDEQSIFLQHLPDWLVEDNVITRAVGGHEDLNLDYQILEIRTADIYLLCSDGLTGEVSDEELSEILSVSTLKKSMKLLFKLATKREAKDNITAILLKAL